MGDWLLLGVDSLIACIAIGPIVERRWSVIAPLVVLFGVGDGAGYLLGTALHWSFPDDLDFLAPVVVAVIGLYWIAVAIVSRRAAKAAEAEQTSKSHWGIWVLPWLLRLDNITYGAVDGVSSGASVWVSALEQALSSLIQAGIGLAIGIAIVYAIPALRQRMWVANAVAGGAMIVAAGVLHAVG
jgi:putative Mn2+ efflux pump MntP